MPKGVPKDQEGNMVQNMSELNDFSQSLSETMMGAEMGFDKITVAQKKMLGIAAQHVKALKSSNEYSEKNRDAARDTVRALETLVDEEASVRDIEKEIVKQRLKGNTAANNQVVAMLKTKKNMLKIKEGFGAVDDFLGGFGSKIMKMMTNPLGLVIAAVGYLIKLFMKFDERVKFAGQNFGALAVQSERVSAAMDSLSQTMANMNMDLQDALPAIKGIGQELGYGTAQSMKLAESIAEASRVTSLSLDSTTKLATTLAKITDISDENLGHTIETVYAFAEMADVAPDAVLEDIANNTEAMSKFAFAGAQQLFRAAIAAKKLGANMGTVESIAESLLDFETSIQKEMELAAILGKRIDFTQARRLAASGDLAGMMENITGQLGRQVDLSKMDYFTQKQLMDTLNISSEQMQGMIRAQQEGVDLSTALAANYEDAGNKAKELTPQDAMSAMEQIGATLKSIENAIVNEMRPAFEDISEKIKYWSHEFQKFIEIHLPKILEWVKWIGIAIAGWKIGSGIFRFSKLFREGGSVHKAMSKGGWMNKAVSKGGWLNRGWSRMTQGITGFFSKMRGGGGKGGGFFSRAWKGIKGGASRLWKGAKNVVSKVADFLNPLKLVKGSFGKIAKKMLKGGLIGAIINAVDLGSALSGPGSKDDKARAVLRSAGGIIGGIAGSAIGSVIPGLGTWLGGMGGGLLGDWLMSKKWAQDPFVPLIRDWMPGGNAKQVDDLAIGRGGATAVIGPAGTFKLNPLDGLVAGTNLGGGADPDKIGRAVAAWMSRVMSQKPTTVITKEEFKQFSTNVNF